MLSVETWPDLRDPVLVIACTGWVDAGLAGSTAAQEIIDGMSAPRRFATYDLGDSADLRTTRPIARLDDGMTRRIEWPTLSFVAGRAGRDTVVLTGPEPCVQWQRVTEEVVAVADRLGVTLAVTLGAMPAAVSHRRPVPVLATATSRPLAQEVGALRADYHGPTGLQSVMQVALGDAGIDGVGLWAQVPHYVSGTPSPPAARALLERLRDLALVSIDLHDLDRRADHYLQQVEDGIAERPDVAEMVAAIDEEEEISGDALASEIEHFLRRDTVGTDDLEPGDDDGDR
jgi:proteasome assembly chaperone (PAC2) family protein